MAAVLALGSKPEAIVLTGYLTSSRTADYLVAASSGGRVRAAFDRRAAQRRPGAAIRAFAVRMRPTRNRAAGGESAFNR